MTPLDLMLWTLAIALAFVVALFVCAVIGAATSSIVKGRRRSRAPRDTRSRRVFDGGSTRAASDSTEGNEP